MALDGTLPDLDGSGFGVRNFSRAGIENGPASGLALAIDSSPTVLEFLSYEGTIASAVDGPATGMASRDLCRDTGCSATAAESEGTPANHSIQRAGTGDGRDDFLFAGPAVATFGDINAGQTFKADCPPSLPPGSPPAPPNAPPPDGGLRGLPTQLGRLTSLGGLRVGPFSRTSSHALRHHLYQHQTPGPSHALRPPRLRRWTAARCAARCPRSWP
jgi:hypothetical protein